MSGKFKFFQGQGIVGILWCQGILHFSLMKLGCFFFAKFIKFLAPILSGKFEFVSGNCRGILVSPTSMNPEHTKEGNSKIWFIESQSKQLCSLRGCIHHIALAIVVLDVQNNQNGLNDSKRIKNIICTTMKYRQMFYDCHKALKTAAVK